MTDLPHAQNWPLPQPISEAAQLRILQLLRPRRISSSCCGRTRDNRDAAAHALVKRFGLQCSPDKLAALVLVAKYNSFACRSVRSSIIYFGPSFCNHCCAPSCSWEIDKDGKFRLCAGGAGLQSGQEITIAYAPAVLGWATDERREHLAVNWKFFLRMCPLCYG